MKTIREYINIVDESSHSLAPQDRHAVELYRQLKAKYQNQIGNNGDELIDGITEARYNTGVQYDGVTEEDLEQTMAAALKDPVFLEWASESDYDTGDFNQLYDAISEYTGNILEAIENYLGVNAVSVQANKDYDAFEDAIEENGATLDPSEIMDLS